MGVDSIGLPALADVPAALASPTPKSNRRGVIGPQRPMASGRPQGVSAVALTWRPVVAMALPGIPEQVLLVRIRAVHPQLDGQKWAWLEDLRNRNITHHSPLSALRPAN
jgi:hypothetical protein